MSSHGISSSIGNHHNKNAGMSNATTSGSSSGSGTRRWKSAVLPILVTNNMNSNNNNNNKKMTGVVAAKTNPKLLKPQQQRPTDEPDAVGRAIQTTLLARRREFQEAAARMMMVRRNHEVAPPPQQQDWTWPLISYRNIQWWRERWKKKKKKNPDRKKSPAAARKRPAENNDVRHHDDAATLLLFLARTLVLVWIVPCCLLGILLAYVLDLLYAATMYLTVSVLVDPLSLVPEAVVAHLRERYRYVAHDILDQTILGGFYFRGRNDDADAEEERISRAPRTVLSERHATDVAYCRAAVARTVHIARKDDDNDDDDDDDDIHQQMTMTTITYEQQQQSPTRLQQPRDGSSLAPSSSSHGVLRRMASPKESIELEVQQPSSDNRRHGKFGDRSPDNNKYGDYEKDDGDDDEDDDADVPWIDVGAHIGLRILHSEHVHRAMHPAAAAIVEQNKKQLSPLQRQQGGGATGTISTTSPMKNLMMKRPMHSMWNDPNSLTHHITAKLPVQPRRPLLPGVRVAVPLGRPYQMATVISSRRIHIDDKNNNRDDDETSQDNALSVTVVLEKSYLRNGQFCQLTFRIRDDDDNNNDQQQQQQDRMPRHSKFPMGSCVSTLVGVGVLVGWRVQHDCHIVILRGPRQRRLIAYLQRESLWELCPAACDLTVETPYGWGTVVSIRRTPQQPSQLLPHNNNHKYTFHVAITDDSKYKSQVLELSADDIKQCPNAQFLPIIEHVREAALYQMQLDQYLSTAGRTKRAEELAQTWNTCGGILWQSFLKAIEEDQEFDNGVNEFMQSMVKFLNGLDRRPDATKAHAQATPIDGGNPPATAPPPHTVIRPDEIEVQLEPPNDDASIASTTDGEQGFWIWNDYFGDLFSQKTTSTTDVNAPETIVPQQQQPTTKKMSSYDRTYALLRTVMKTVSLAQAASVNEPHFRMALAIVYDFLLFVRTAIRIQQQRKNVTEDSRQVWKRAWLEIRTTFGPIQKRLQRIGEGIAVRMERQGRKAKLRLVKLIDKILTDENLLAALEHGEWEKCLARLEVALVGAEIIIADNLLYYRKAVRFILEHFQMMLGQSDEGVASRNNQKLELLGMLVQSMAAPKRSILSFLCRDDTMGLFERILVRAYHKEQLATRMLTIHAANFHSLRHLRLLKDFSVSGNIWMPVLNAADEELSWLVSKMPEKSKGFMCPLSSLFSLCVAQFHKINAGDMARDWLDFLLEEDSARIIQELNTTLILALESFSKDIKDMIKVLPYYPSIDSDILNLMDEVNLDEFLKDTASAIDDPEKLSAYLCEKATLAVERFLNYLPKLSIPVEKRDLGEGWVLTCHGKEGGDLTLTDVTIKRENLVCQILGGDTLFFPMFIEDDQCSPRFHSYDETATFSTGIASPHEEESVLDHIRHLILNAQQSGCWKPGFGGIGQQPTDRYAAKVLHGLPISSVLNCGIELWRSLEIDDDELLEIAIRDISYHIELRRKMDSSDPSESIEDAVPSIDVNSSLSFGSHLGLKLSESSGREDSRRRFNPRVDPTVLFLEIKRLTLTLDNFFFRIEQSTRATIFDPVFEGRGRLSLQSILISLRVEVAKQHVKKSQQGGDVSIPVLRLRDLEVSMEKLQLTVTDTSFGSDWILNKAVSMFEEKLTAVVEENLKQQIREQLDKLIENLNSYFLVNPGLLLNLLGISMDDLDFDTVVWV